MNDIEAVDVLKPLARRLGKLYERCIDDGKLDAADEIQQEMDALHRAMSLLGNRHGRAMDGEMEVHLADREIVELLALIRDDDGEADEGVLAEVEQKLAGVLRSIIRRQLTEGVAA